MSDELFFAAVLAVINAMMLGLAVFVFVMARRAWGFATGERIEAAALLMKVREERADWEAELTDLEVQA